jgi:aldehyde:ferredoxin oxidoreductase
MCMGEVSLRVHYSEGWRVSVKGYQNRLLRVDLDSGSLKNEGLPPKDVLKKFIGGTGLAEWVYCQEVKPGVRPFDSENRLVFMTGPLTGTAAPCPNNSTCVTLNVEVNYAFGVAHGHGFFGSNLKFAGYDGIIVHGASEKPVYLWINNDQVELKDATKFWGMDTHETGRAIEEALKEEYGVKSRISVAAIGPGGENMCAGGMIANDEHHHFAKGGVGSVMGSKKLKAIAVAGDKKVPLDNQEKFMQMMKTWRENTFVQPSFAWWIREWYGGADVIDWKKEHSLIAVKNLSTADDRAWHAMMAEMRAGKTAKVKPVPCYGCPIGCSYRIEITDGPYKGLVATPSGGGESIEGAAAIVGIWEAGAVFHMMELYDRLGLDSSTAGCALALAFECYEKGLLTKEDTGGLELTWGNVQAAEKLLKMYANKEGLGRILSMGIKRAAEAIGRDAPKYAVHIKGMGINLHDWRPVWGILLGQIVAGAGPRWEADGIDSWAPETDLGYPKLLDGPTHIGKPEAVRLTAMKKLWEDSVGSCWFSAWGVKGSLDFIPKAVNYATGFDLTPEDALAVGERILNFERVFSIERGFTVEDDFDIGPRFLEPPDMGHGAGKSIAPYLRGMVMEYYRLMGWDESTGKPWRTTLNRLGLQQMADSIWR